MSLFCHQGLRHGRTWVTRSVCHSARHQVTGCPGPRPCECGPHDRVRRSRAALPRAPSGRPGGDSAGRTADQGADRRARDLRAMPPIRRWPPTSSCRPRCSESSRRCSPWSPRLRAGRRRSPLWFLNFSTWEGVHGIYLEDLYVRPELPRQGFGKALLQSLAAIAVAPRATPASSGGCWTGTRRRSTSTGRWARCRWTSGPSSGCGEALALGGSASVRRLAVLAGQG